MAVQDFIKLVRHPIKFRLFQLYKLPSAFFSGIKPVRINRKRCEVIVPFRWFSQNPFKSTYFACLAMGAEMSTGLLAMAHIYQREPGVSMLVTEMHAQYFKKATAKTRFICEDGDKIAAAIARAIETKEGVVLTVAANGFNKDGELIATMQFTWSFKVKNK